MRVAVIGAGRMGRRHVRIVSELGHTLAGLCDANAAAVQNAAREDGLDESVLFTDPSAMLARSGCDCVIVATTAPSHCELTCAAAEHGVKAIVCEKPMAISLEECDRMLDACARSGTKLAVNHQMRFMEQYQVPKALLTSEAFGGFAGAMVAGGNFGIAMNGSHYFEMFRYLTDERPFEVTAWFSPDTVANPRGPQFEDRAGSVRITTASGKRLYLDATSDQGHGMSVLYSARNGQIFVNELTGAFSSSVREGAHRALPTTRYGMPSLEESRVIIPADAIEPSKAVLKALLVGGDFPTGEDGRSAIEVLVAAHVSNEEGHRAVRLDRDVLPRQRRFSWA